MSTGHYIHGSHAAEQSRLANLNAIINGRCLDEIHVTPGDSIVDFGSGLGQLSVALAERAGEKGRVVGIERDERQLAEARSSATRMNVEFRAGDALDPPLAPNEWGSFDVAHARFVLEHVPDALGVVKQMARAVRPGGRIILADDDHDVLRLWPDVPEFDRVWRAYIQTYERLGNDPFVGRKLPALLHGAGARPVRATSIFFGACAGERVFEPLVTNSVRILEGAADAIVSLGLLDEPGVRAGIDALKAWGKRPDAALWFVICFAEGVVP